MCVSTHVGCGGVWLGTRPDVSVLPGSQPRGYQGNVNTVCVRKVIKLWRCSELLYISYTPPLNSCYMSDGVLSRQHMDLQRLTGQDCFDVGPEPGRWTYSGILWAWVGGQWISYQSWYTDTHTHTVSPLMSTHYTLCYLLSYQLFSVYISLCWWDLICPKT